MKKLLAVTTITAALALTGCSSAATSSASQTPSSQATGSQAASSTGAQSSVADRAGLQGLDAKTIVERLDASEDDREAGPAGSVRPTELRLTDKATGETQNLPLPTASFYLAMAPYEKQTHECFNHNTASCRGELIEEKIHVTLTTDDGQTLVDKDVTTMKNGFASMWVPFGKKGTLTITARGKSVTTPVSTGAEDPTCLTTPLKLA